jgi:hypothetical protein
MLWRKNFGWCELSVGVFVMVHDKTPPGDADWSDCLVDLHACARRAAPRAIVFTDGGAPDGRQREALNRVVMGKAPPTAVVSDALVTRFVVSSLALINPSIASFAAYEIDDAWRHLGLRQADARLATADLMRQARLMGPVFVTLRAALQLPDLRRVS